MKVLESLYLGGCVLAALTVPTVAAHAQGAAGIAAPDQTIVTVIHAQGAQVYECKSDPLGKLVWVFREPIATLLQGGETIGRHYAGPSWELNDGSSVVGKVASRAPGASAQDIPLLKLDVLYRQGAGRLSDVATIQRINTKGGVAEGACEKNGELLSVPYSADYAFLKRAR